MENRETDSRMSRNNSLNLRVFVVTAKKQQKLHFCSQLNNQLHILNTFLKGESMSTESFTQILDNKINNYWKNTLKMPVLTRDEQGNYYLKDV